MTRRALLVGSCTARALENQETRSWEPLDRSFRSAIRDGLRIARKQSAPDLIRLPLLAPKRGEI